MAISLTSDAIARRASRAPPSKRINKRLTHLFFVVDKLGASSPKELDSGDNLNLGMLIFRPGILPVRGEWTTSKLDLYWIQAKRSRNQTNAGDEGIRTIMSVLAEESDEPANLRVVESGEKKRLTLFALLFCARMIPDFLQTPVKPFPGRIEVLGGRGKSVTWADTSPPEGRAVATTRNANTRLCGSGAP